MRGRSPRDYFCVSVPDEGGGLEDEVMGGDDLLGQRNGPVLPDSLPRRTSHHPLFHITFSILLIVLFIFIIVLCCYDVM